MDFATPILSAVGLLVAVVALGLVLVLRRRLGVKPRPSLSERLMGISSEEFGELKKDPEAYGFYRLETILTEFKKALASTQQESARHAKERPKIAYGERSTYTIQSLEVSLKGRITHVPDCTPATSDIRVAFTGQPEEMSELRFTASTVPPHRTIVGAGIFFTLDPSRLTPTREVRIDRSRPLRLTLMACDEDGNFLYNHRIDASFYRCAGEGQGPDADTSQGDTCHVFTNSQGRVEISFDGPDTPGTYRIHVLLRDPEGEKLLKEDNYYFEAVEG